MGIHSGSDQASIALQESAGRRGGAVLIDAAMPEPDGSRFAIRMVRERFPTLRVVVYGADLDAPSIDGLYLVGADAVVLSEMDGDEVVATILASASRLDAAGRPPIHPVEVQSAVETPVPNTDLVETKEPSQMEGEAEPAPEDRPQAIPRRSNRARWKSLRGIWDDQASAMEDPATEEPPVDEVPPPRNSPQQSKSLQRPRSLQPWRSLQP